MSALVPIGDYQRNDRKIAINTDNFFGLSHWEKYIGSPIGFIPEIPVDIDGVLESPCPFWDDKKIKDTHMLVLIPTNINGTPLTINNFETLLNLEDLGLTSAYRGFDQIIKKDLGCNAIYRSYWVLMTRDVIPESKNKELEMFDKNELYNLPTTLEAIICILTEYIKNRTTCFKDDREPVFTRCSETTEKDKLPAVVGSLNEKGLFLTHDFFDDDFGGIAAIRRF